MKKLTALTICVILLFCKANTQTYDTTQYYGKMNYVFQYVDKIQITTGFLRDYGIEFLNLDNYQGIVLHDSNYVALDDWRLLYTSLYSSQINSNAGMLYLDSVNRLIRKFNYTNMPITFIGLDYNYNKLRDDAITNNLMYVSNDHLYDVSGRTQSPYESKELFAVAPIRQAALTGSNQFIFRPELFLSNAAKTISSIAYDASGGSNYQTIAFNTPFTVSYNNSGFFDFNVRITYTDNSIRYTHTKIVVYENPNGNSARYGIRPTTNEVVTATKAYQNVFASGDITIDLAVNNTTGQIRKPLIVVEGFDPDGGVDYGQILLRITRDINLPGVPFITLNDGLDDINEYDLIFLNFQNATDYIQRNAYLLEAAIQLVNNRKTLWNGVRQQNVIIGMSMGGLVTRYALRDLELNGQNHETRLFISHDSPHWGANVPVGAQIAVQHLAPWKILNINGTFPFISWVDMFPQAVDALNLFNSPAAKQMLIQRYTLNGQTLSADNSTHTSFLNEINQMGWPVNCRNITLANGACNGTKVFPDNSTMFTIDGNRDMKYLGSLWRSLAMTISGGTLNFVGIINGWGNPQFNAWAELWQFPLSLISTKNSIGVDFKIRAVPISGTQEIYRGDVFSKKKVLGLINVKNYFISSHINSTTTMLPLDNSPGGKYDVNQFGLDPNIIAAGLPNFFQGYIQASTLQPQFCFVPTVSSLAINNPQSNLFNSLCNNVNCLSPAAVQDYYAPQQNELHISYTQNNSDWILQRQNASFTCIKICPSSLYISGDHTICTTSSNYLIPNLPTGVTIHWEAYPQGIVTVNSPNSPQTTLTRIGNGEISLTATATACAIIDLPAVSINVGQPTPVESLMIDGINPATTMLCHNQESMLTVYPEIIEQSISYVWDLPTDWVSLETGTNSATTQDYMLPAYPGSDGTIYVRRLNECGYSSLFSVNVFFDPWCGNYYTISPNPATDNITIDGQKQKRNIKEVQIIDKTGQVRKTAKFGNNVQRVNLNISDLTPDIYYIKIFDGKEWKSKPIIIK
jgi:hypothetical protein